jgi:hypothetical protein
MGGNSLLTMCEYSIKEGRKYILRVCMMMLNVVNKIVKIVMILSHS